MSKSIALLQPVSYAVGDVVHLKRKYLCKFSPKPRHYVISDVCVWPELNEVRYAVSGVSWFRRKAFSLVSRATFATLEFALQFASMGPVDADGEEVIDFDPEPNLELDLKFHSTLKDDLDHA